MQRHCCFAFSLCSSPDASQISSIPYYGLQLTVKERLSEEVSVFLFFPTQKLFCLPEYIVISFAFFYKRFNLLSNYISASSSPFMLLIVFMCFFRKR